MDYLCQPNILMQWWSQYEWIAAYFGEGMRESPH